MDSDIRGIGEASLYVDDIDSTEEWYNEVLGLETVRHGKHYCFLDTGADSDARQRVILFDADTTCQQETPPPHGTVGASHVAFDTAYSALDDWREALDTYDVPIEAEHEWPSGDRSLYFRDPDDNSLELWGRKRLDQNDTWYAAVTEYINELQDAVTGILR